MDLSILEKNLGLVFRDKDLLRQALTHRSFLNENERWPVGHNERLEFLGDAVMELVVTEFIFKRYPNKPEGHISQYRAALVNLQSSASYAESFGLGDFLFLSRGEAKDKGRAREAILGNAFEALVGAVYLDQGLETVQKFITRIIVPKVNDVIAKFITSDTKSRLQEITQAKKGVTPNYKVLKESGLDHKKRFVVGVLFGENLIAEGEGCTKKLAEEEAARHALELNGWLVATGRE